MTYALIVLGIILLIAVKMIYDKKTLRTKYINQIRKEFGKVPQKEYTYEKLASIPNYFNKRKDGRLFIDDITYNDLSLEDIYFVLNATYSAPGEEVLYKILRTPETDEGILSERERVISFFENNQEVREEIGFLLKCIGGIKNISLYQYMHRLGDLRVESNAMHYFQAFLLVAALGMIPLNPVVGIIAAVVMFFINVTTYFKRKSEIEKYIAVVACLLRLIDSAEELCKADIPELSDYISVLRNNVKAFSGFRRGAGILTPSGVSTDMIQSLFDYIRMAFHLDLIKFNSMLTFFMASENEFDEMFETIGFLDSMIAIASFRKTYPRHCIPFFISDKKLDMKNAYHMLIEEPVTNDFSTTDSCLITGSNASGKSTFLKMTAINQILAQSIHTVLADSYEAGYFHVISSMALNDNLLNGESYYIVETRSLKRIMDTINSCSVPCLIFIDEVLRGTNTLERISASAVILSSLAKTESICFAATHDYELTFILEDLYDNYHFEEVIDEYQVLFDYTIKSGRCMTRNAIRLLGMLGYSEEIIAKATEMANDYLAGGEWKKISKE